MLNPQYISFFSCLRMVLWAVGYSSVPSSAEEQRPEVVLQEIAAKSAKQCEDDLRSFSITFTELVNDASLLNYGGSELYELTFDNGRFYERRISHPIDPPIPDTNDVSFDGSVLYIAQLRKDSTIPGMVTKYSIGDRADYYRTLKLWEVPYLNAAGFQFPVRISELVGFETLKQLLMNATNKPDVVTSRFEDKNLFVILRIRDPELQAVAEMDLDAYMSFLAGGKRFTASALRERRAMYERLRRLPRERLVNLTLDPDVGYSASRREEFTPEGKLIRRVVASAFSQFRKGIWLPRDIKVLDYMSYDYSQFSLEPIRTTELRLVRIAFGVGGVEFGLTRRPEYTRPGVSITDRTVPEAANRRKHQVTYTVAASGRLLEDSAREVRGKLVSNRFWGIILVILLLPPAIFGILQLRGTQK